MIVPGGSHLLGKRVRSWPMLVPMCLSLEGYNNAEQASKFHVPFRKTASKQAAATMLAGPFLLLVPDTNHSVVALPLAQCLLLLPRQMNHLNAHHLAPPALEVHIAFAMVSHLPISSFEGISEADGVGET